MKAEEQTTRTTQSSDGYAIPNECKDKDRECGKCEFTDAKRKAMGCTVDPFEEE